MIHSSRFLAIYVLLAALIYVHALECYDYYIRRGANGYSQQSTRPVKCPKSEYCIQLFGMLRTGPNSKFPYTLISNIHADEEVQFNSI